MPTLNTFVAFSVDADGCFYHRFIPSFLLASIDPSSPAARRMVIDHNHALLRHIQNRAREYPKGQDIYCGSMRQSFPVDQHNATRNNTPLFIDTLQDLRDHLVSSCPDLQLNTYLLPDSFANRENGSTFKVSTSPDRHTIPNTEHKRSPIEEEKVSLVYAQMHNFVKSKSEIAAPDDEYVFNFYDNHDDKILSKIKAAFEQFPHAIPPKLTLNLYHYTDGVLKKYATLKGNESSILDHDYKITLRDMLGVRSNSLFLPRLYTVIPSNFERALLRREERNKLHEVKKAKTFHAASMDADGSVYHLYFHKTNQAGKYGTAEELVISHNKVLLDHLRSQAGSHISSDLFHGSARQSSFGRDRFGAQFHKTPLFINTMVDLHQHLVITHPNVRLNTYLLPDSYEKAPYGSSFEAARYAAQNLNNNPDAPQSPYNKAPMDEAKVTLIYAQMHKFVIDKMEDGGLDAEYCFDFFDDRDDILSRLKFIFETYPHAIPPKLTLNLYHYKAGRLVLYATLKGNADSILDRDYETTISRMFDADHLANFRTRKTDEYKIQDSNVAHALDSRGKKNNSPAAVISNAEEEEEDVFYDCDELALLEPVAAPAPAIIVPTPTAAVRIIIANPVSEEDEMESNYQTALKELDAVISSAETQKNNSFLIASAKEVRDAVVQITAKNSLMPNETSTLTEILTHTKNCCVNKDPFAFRALSDISQQATFKNLTKRSWGNILKGSVLVFLGAVIITASVLVAVQTAGIASPLSALGINMGISLATAGAAIACTVVGAGISTVGAMGLATSSPLNEAVQNMLGQSPPIPPALSRATLS